MNAYGLEFHDVRVELSGSIALIVAKNISLLQRFLFTQFFWRIQLLSQRQPVILKSNRRDGILFVTSCTRVRGVMLTNGDIDVRVDKWLWAARFFKTRSSASKAVTGGRIYINGGRSKPSRPLRVGDILRIHKDEIEYVVTVLALKAKRGPAVEARKMYVESEESILAREKAREQRRLEAGQQFGPKRRPGKRDRRLIVNFTRQNE